MLPGGKGRSRVGAGVMTAVLLFSASGAAAGDQGSIREMSSLTEDREDDAGNPAPGFRLRLSPLIFLAATGGAGSIRGLNFRCPMGGDSLRFQLNGSLGFRPGDGKLETGGFLTVSYDF